MGLMYTCVTGTELGLVSTFPKRISQELGTDCRLLYHGNSPFECFTVTLISPVFLIMFEMNCANPLLLK